MKLIDMVINDIPKVGIETYNTSEINYVVKVSKHPMGNFMIESELKDNE